MQKFVRSFVNVAMLALALVVSACSGTNPSGPDPVIPGGNLDSAMVKFTYDRDTACTRLCEMPVRFGSVYNTWPEAFDITKNNQGKAPEMTLLSDRSDGSTWMIDVKVPAKGGLCVAVGDPNQEANGGQTGLRIKAILANGAVIPLLGNGAQACFDFSPPDRLTPVR